jgi:glyoxylase-like metal-dependent hydrolase (beta-lactamase superfamily II)
MPNSGCQVITVQSLISNAFIIRGDRTVIVDTGVPGREAAMLQTLDRHGILPSSVSLILLTHGHLDHFGSALALKQATGAPVAIHTADAHCLRSGTNPPLKPSCAMGHVFKPFFQNRTIAPFEPDIVIDQERGLGEFGIDARVVFTPGHTPGSVSVMLADGQWIVGDLLIGGYLGGVIAPGLPGLPYFFDDEEQLRQSIRAMVALGPTQIHVGHGGPLDPKRVARLV